MEITIDLMQNEDIEQVMEIEEASFSNPWSKNAFESELDGNNRYAYYLVARADEGIVGYLGTWFIVDEAHITNIAVKPSARRMGIGKLLINSLFEQAKLRKVMGVTLEVRVTNLPAQNLYNQLGFKAVGFRPEYYQDNGEDALIMWKILDGAGLE